jgi:small subunit ribosomal protein S17
MRTTLIGIVTSDKSAKTRRVEVKRLFRHPKFGKIVRGRTVCHVHDEDNQSRSGDRVEIVESRPHSKTKRWELLRIVHAAADAEVEAARAHESEFTEADLREEPEAETAEGVVRDVDEGATEPAETEATDAQADETETSEA